jgi:hypothetical protein
MEKLKTYFFKKRMKKNQRMIRQDKPEQGSEGVGSDCRGDGNWVGR